MLTKYFNSASIFIWFESLVNSLSKKIYMPNSSFSIDLLKHLSNGRSSWRRINLRSKTLSFLPENNEGVKSCIKVLFTVYAISRDQLLFHSFYIQFNAYPLVNHYTLPFNFEIMFNSEQNSVSFKTKNNEMHINYQSIIFWSESVILVHISS